MFLLVIHRIKDESILLSRIYLVVLDTGLSKKHFRLVFHKKIEALIRTFSFRFPHSHTGKIETTKVKPSTIYSTCTLARDVHRKQNKTKVAV